MKKFNNIGKNIVLITVVIAIFTCLLCGCIQRNTGLNKNYNDIPLTIEEITQKTWEKYFNEDGTPKRSAWGALFYEDGTLKEYWDYGYANQINSLDEITGFEVSIIKSVYNHKPAWYLIEFEPSCYIHGHLYLDYGATMGTGLSLHPSPFKILDIDPDNRYCDLRKYATIRDGVMTGIKNEAYFKYGITKEDCKYTEIYDYEKNEWVKIYN